MGLRPDLGCSTTKKIISSRGGKKHRTYERLIGVHTYLIGDCLLKHVTEGKVKETNRRGRRRKQLLVDLNPLALELDIYSLAQHLCKI